MVGSDKHGSNVLELVPSEDGSALSWLHLNGAGSYHDVLYGHTHVIANCISKHLNY